MTEFCLKNRVFGLGMILLICLAVLPITVSCSEILYEGPLTLSDESIAISSYNSDQTYDVTKNTPLGVLASVSDLSLKVSDKKYDGMGILLLDGIDSFEYDKDKGSTWVCEVNGVILDDYGNPDTDGLNVKILSPDDTLAFYYGNKPISAENALASVIFGKGENEVDLEAQKSEISSPNSVSNEELSSVSGEIPEGNSWTLILKGAITETMNQSYFEEGASCHKGNWTDESGNEYTGIPLWRLVGWVDDEDSHSSEGFNEDLYTAGYTITVKAGDGYEKEFSTQEIGTSDDVLIANEMNGEPLPQDGEKPSYPLKLVGPSINGGNSVGNIAEIVLSEFSSLEQLDPSVSSGSTESKDSEIPSIHIVVFGDDGKTIINETTVNYRMMEESFPVIGDGETEYKYESITNNPDDIWGADQNFAGGFKIKSVVKGTLVRDLVDLVGGMEPGTSIKLIASDGYETKLGYSSVYPNPDAILKAGEPFVAWYKGGKTIPDFKEGYQLFFTGGDDNVFSNWDMHETMESNLWHYYWEAGVQYPSAAGLATKYIDEIHVYTAPESEWELFLDGSSIGGVITNISSGYYDSALVCQFGSNHSGTYKDSQGTSWEGMPLWFLCGFVDDADQHSNNAFNESLANSGYKIIVTGENGTTLTIDSGDAKRNDGYILASIKDDIIIQADDPSWPLVLTGSAVSEPVLKVNKIQLKPLE